MYKKTCHEETNFLPKPVFGGIQPGPTQTGLAGGARWLSGRVSDYGARGRGFETYRPQCCVLEQDTLLPESTG